MGWWGVIQVLQNLRAASGGRGSVRAAVYPRRRTRISSGTRIKRVLPLRDFPRSFVLDLPPGRLQFRDLLRKLGDDLVQLPRRFPRLTALRLRAHRPIGIPRPFLEPRLRPRQRLEWRGAILLRPFESAA